MLGRMLPQPVASFHEVAYPTPFCLQKQNRHSILGLAQLENINYHHIFLRVDYIEDPKL